MTPRHSLDVDDVIRVRARLERQIHARRRAQPPPTGPGPQRYDDTGFPIRQRPASMTDRLRRLLSE
jgi:hypothetical protein